ncbi:GGDEF domain-containing protein [Pantoea stewartii]|uniref:GGDEF domain-containing protein n=1 Tax=Pantoea stewartii TaxID=66269 RepID=UPI00062FF93C|nr:GGDEF domain-containing protein [Pantoea stewartii]KKW51054.1 diguanylate cyclase [Pantoea ananatis]MCU7366687.1 GGDEF domain-containing protein [Pantoea stewartii]
MTHLNELFLEETQALNHASHVAAQSCLHAEEYRQALSDLNNHYQRLMRETYRLISRSDRAERELNRVNEQLIELTRELEYKATHDPLTNVWNRSAIIKRISDTLTRTPAALIILDIDFFKRINDEYGHPTGDKVICELVQRIQRNTPDIASIGRIGGEEFTIMLPDTFLGEAVIVAGAILASLNASPLDALPERLVTASLGVSWGAAGSHFEALYTHADAALYDAKKHGRNRVFFR